MNCDRTLIQKCEIETKYIVRDRKNIMIRKDCDADDQMRDREMIMTEMEGNSGKRKLKKGQEI